MQRVDLLVDGKLRNVGQRSSSPALLARITRAIGSAELVEVRRSSSTPAPAPLPGLAMLARNVVFFANVTGDAAGAFLALPARWRGAVTADEAYHSAELEALIAGAHKQGRPLAPWCDCREPDGDPPGTPFRAARAMQARYGLGEPIGECESSTEFDHALAAGARLLIGNPTALDAGRRAEAGRRIAAGTLAIIGEMYRPDAGYSAEGVDIASVCYGVALDDGAHTPVSAYLEASSPAERATFGVYHAAGLEPADWRELR